MLDIHRLSLLREVKLHGSMSAAARNLSYSHSAVSQQMAVLEREAGVKLLEKVGRNVKLTSAGEELVRNTETILAALERAESDLATSHERVHGVVTLAAFATISRTVLPAVLEALSLEHPDLEVRIHRFEPEDAVIRLVSRRVDAVITDSFPGTAEHAVGDLHTTVLGHDSVRGYLPHGQDFDSFEQARQVRWVMEPAESAAAQWATRVCRERGIEPVVAHVSSDLLFHLRLVEHGLAAAFLPDMVVRETGSDIQPSPWLPVEQQRVIQFLVRSGTEKDRALLAVREAVSRALSDGPDL